MSTAERYPLLATIDSPADLRHLDRAQLPQLVRELRAFLLQSVAKTGGHLSSNLGTVELTVALHYIFDTPQDRIVWDVGHQTYAHKILTGRREQMDRLRQWGGPSGFPRRDESEYDTFGTAHSSTSISAALGMATAARLSGDPRHVVAVIGDGAMSAGMAFEALNNAEGTDLLVVLNDNDMSISEPVGAINQYLAKVLASRFYNTVQQRRQGGAVEAAAGARAREARRGARQGDGAAGHAVRGVRLQLHRSDRRPRHRAAHPDARERPQARAGRSSCTSSRARATAMRAPRRIRSSTTACRSSIRRWASFPRAVAHRPTRRSSATGFATWRAPTGGWSASPRRCARARAWSNSRSSSRSATSTSASPSSMR